MTDKLRSTINPVIWKDTGETFESRKIYLSILGHYAMATELGLVKLPKEALEREGVLK